MYYDIEHDEFVTCEQLRGEYAEKIQLGEIDPKEQTFADYVANCNTRANGILETAMEYFRRMDDKFDDFLCERADEIDSVTLRLLSTLADTELTWNAHLASMPLDAAEATLRESGIEVCWPYYCDEDRVPCYRSGTCKNKVCKFTGRKMM